MDNLNLSTQEEWEILKEKLDKIQREVHELYLMRNGAIGPFIPTPRRSGREPILWLVNHVDHNYPNGRARQSIQRRRLRSP